MNLDQQLREANQRYVKNGPAIPQDAVPAQHLAIVTCMDVRIDPLAVLGLSLGSAHVIRNAGARVTEDVIRSLAVSQQVLGTRAVIVLPHTRCGMINFDPSRLMLNPSIQGDSAMKWYPITNLADDLTQDFRDLRQSPWLLPEMQILGYILDVTTGAINPV